VEDPSFRLVCGDAWVENINTDNKKSARYRKLHQKKNREQNSVSELRLSSSNATNQGNHPLVIAAVLLLMMVHLLLDLLNQTLLLLVLRARRTRPNASLLLLMSNTTVSVSTDTSSVGSPNIARSVGARLSRQVGGVGQRAGIGLHALALDVGVLADLLAAGGGDGVGVDAVVAALFGGLEGCVGVVGLGWGD
jgi:hypothetical protein